jgi:hypothetical protein
MVFSIATASGVAGEHSRVANLCMMRCETLALAALRATGEDCVELARRSHALL